MPVPGIIQTDLNANAGIGKYLLNIPVALVGLTTALQFTITPKHKGRLISASFHTNIPGTNTAATVSLTPAIAGTNVTGGVIPLTLASTSDRGEITPASAITALNSFTASQSITWTAAVTTTFSAGSGHIEMEIVNDDTREAVAHGNFGYRTLTE